MDAIEKRLVLVNLGALGEGVEHRLNCLPPLGDLFLERGMII